MPKHRPAPVTPEHYNEPLSAVEVLRRDHRLELQFRFLAAFILVVTLLLAGLMQLQQNAVREQGERLAWSAHKACNERRALAEQYNQSRMDLIQFWTERQRDQSPEAIYETQERLSRGLLLPIEDCGEAPPFPDPGTLS